MQVQRELTNTSTPVTQATEEPAGRFTRTLSGLRPMASRAAAAATATVSPIVISATPCPSLSLSLKISAQESETAAQPSRSPRDGWMQPLHGVWVQTLASRSAEASRIAA